MVKFVGIISDTHNLLRPEAIKALAGSELIIHAGDIGSKTILEELAKIAPLYAVRGNNDKENWAKKVPVSRTVEVREHQVFVIHNLQEIDFDPVSRGLDVVISGHSHRPSIRRENGVLYINPGSAGPRRFRLPVALGRLTISTRELNARIVYLA